MKIVIIAGGTGSIALQSGLAQLLRPLDGIETKILVNAYDNGLSTGAVRKVLNGQILGPSDVRKNHTTRLELLDPQSPWLKFLNIRFTEETTKARSFCADAIAGLVSQLGAAPLQVEARLNLALDSFFKQPLAEKIDYDDFSIANIIYAGFAAHYNNSLRMAAKEMAGLMGVQDDVILNSDESLFLGAVSKNGIHVTDEADIVSWGKVNDPFVGVFFYDSMGNETRPVLCDEARIALETADLIILAPGTQWSSLIPTYETAGFKEAVASSSARIVMVMNRQPDKDSPGQTASDIVNQITPKYFPMKRIRLVIDTDGHEMMATVDASTLDKKLLRTENIKKTSLRADLFDKNRETVHSPEALASTVLIAAYKEFLGQKHFMFDYDDTLVGRSGRAKNSSRFNRAAVMFLALNTFRHAGSPSVSICTGNSIRAVNMVIPSIMPILGHLPMPHIDRARPPLTVFADGGINMYQMESQIGNTSDDGVVIPEPICIDETCRLVSDELLTVDALKMSLVQNGIPANKIENRGDVMLSIKPIQSEYRPAMLSLIRYIIQDLGLMANATGRSTIDISKFHLSKGPAAEYILKNVAATITYVGDEFGDGNDEAIAKLGTPHIKCMHTTGPAETAVLLTALLTYLECS